MVQTKKMNESFFAQLLKDFNVAGELIRARQEEKQGLLNDFDSECKRFFFGKISERALMSSVRKTNDELHRLDAEIRQNIAKSRRLADRAGRLTSAQAPIGFRATLSGISGGNKKKIVKKRTVKKRTPKKTPAKKRKVVKKKKTTRKK
ncbi:hypothetical protein KAT24_00030 [Candidatus Pacearchaeota archaeon]|nr:hypothetical protein [Candidatus Pacearchaeota archaeon]